VLNLAPKQDVDVAKCIALNCGFDLMLTSTIIETIPVFSYAERWGKQATQSLSFGQNLIKCKQFSLRCSLYMHRTSYSYLQLPTVKKTLILIQRCISYLLSSGVVFHTEHNSRLLHSD